MRHVGTHELRELYLNFFETHGHTRLPAAPLVPENDPSVLFTTAGMHPLVPYLKGEGHPLGKRLTNVQKCLRTTDIDEVGDATHATVFEMLGNWSLGDYFKAEAIAWSWQFLTGKEWLGIDPRRLAVSVFAGDADAPRDAESADIWQQQGVALERIAFLDKQENWWPTGGGVPGPQGPDTEMFFWTGQARPPDRFDPGDPHWVEIWNDVFMEFQYDPESGYAALAQKNVDTGMGVERVVMVLNGLASIYDIDTYRPLMELVRAAANGQDERYIRIVADHIKAATFLLADEHPVLPSNVERGYVLRRLIRRAVRSARQLEVDNIGDLMVGGITAVVSQYGTSYPTFVQYEARAQDEMAQEVERFEAVLAKGVRQFQIEAAQLVPGGMVSGTVASTLYQTYGFPIELTQEMAREHGLDVDVSGFEQAMHTHQETSRLGSARKFAGGLADHSQASVRHHTATHLLHQALRTVLGEAATQKGSNITPERLRFDYSHPTKPTAAELAAVEHLVNQKISEDVPVVRAEMTVDEARAAGALGLFGHKYGERVSVYTIGDFSREICGGPHVTRTGELGHFRIVKEEAVNAGVRRIRAILE